LKYLILRRRSICFTFPGGLCPPCRQTACGLCRPTNYSSFLFPLRWAFYECHVGWRSCGPLPTYTLVTRHFYLVSCIFMFCRQTACGLLCPL